MRTNIDIDDDLMAKAMQAGPYSTKKDAVEAGLRLLARQAAYREILKWRGKLQWEGDESIDWTETRPERTPEVAEPSPRFGERPAKAAAPSKPVSGKRRAGR
jgi:Arc/MetJ family transcription regulator